jgi:hypothetical protein
VRRRPTFPRLVTRSNSLLGGGKYILSSPIIS